MPEKTDRTGKGFRKSLVWQRARELVLLMYRNTEKFTKHEMFGLTSQVRRAAVSVPANVAEGYAAGARISLDGISILPRAPWRRSSII